MIIDKNGVIDVPNLGLKISPEFTLEELKSNHNFKDFIHHSSNENHIIFGIANMLINNLPFEAHLIFYKNRILQTMINTTAIVGKTDAEWTSIKEADTKSQHDKWLLEQHGATYKRYLWGVIESVGGIASSLSEILVTYIKCTPDLWNKKIIDENGELEIQSLRLRIGPQFDFTSLKSIPQDDSFKITSFSNGFSNCYFRNVVIAELPFSCFLGFHNEKIVLIHLRYKGFMGKSPTDWSAEQENQTKAMHDEWIAHLFGERRIKSKWGIAGSIIDDRFQYVARIFVRYNIPENKSLIDLFSKLNNSLYPRIGTYPGTPVPIDYMF